MSTHPEISCPPTRTELSTHPDLFASAGTLITPFEEQGRMARFVVHEGFAVSPSGVVWRPTAVGMKLGTLAR
jgi:hypothetical protein